MIYYFSATGNSQWVAEELARLTGDKCASITDLIREGDGCIEASDKLGIVFPVHAYGAPGIVLDFVKRLKVSPGCFGYVVATCGSEAGYAFEMVEKYVRQSSNYSVRMPNNYLIGYDVNSEALVKTKLRETSEKLLKIADSVNNRRSETIVTRGLSEKGSYSYYNNYQSSIDARPFKAEESCISCGKCVEVCPLGNISLKNGKPKWGDDCMLCMACINHCPERAIQYGKHTQKKGRYTFSMVEHFLNK